MVGLVIVGLVGFVGAVLVVLYACADAKRRAGKIVQRPTDGIPLEHALNLSYPPPRIELVPCDDIPCSDPGEITGYVERLRALGFEDAGRFQVTQIPELYWWAFVKAETGVTLIFSARDGKSANFEMATHYSDGTSFAFGCGPQVGLVTSPPHWTMRRMAETDPAAVYERFLVERPNGPIDPDHVEDFVPRFQDRYARNMDWRNLRGGYTEDEIRAISAALGLSPTNEMVVDCRQRFAVQALRGVEVALQEQFFMQAQLSDAEAEALLPWMVVIHDRLDFDMLVPIFTGRWWAAFEALIPEPCPEAEEIRALGKRPREAFALLNEHMPGPKFQLIGRVTEPVEADVYVTQNAPLPSRFQQTDASG